MSSTHIFGLSTKQIGHTTFTVVVLKSHSRSSDGVIAITPDMTAKEIDSNIDFLIQELETLRARAKVVTQ